MASKQILNRRERILTDSLPPEITDTSGFITATDYATSTTGGTVKVDGTYQIELTSGGKIKAKELTAEAYAAANDAAFVSKGTLDNVLAAQGGNDVIYSTTPQKVGKWVDNKDLYRVCIPFENTGSDLNIDMVPGEGYVADMIIFECAFIKRANNTTLGLNFMYQSYADAALQPIYDWATHKIQMKGQSTNNRGPGYVVILFTRTAVTPPETP